MFFSRKSSQLPEPGAALPGRPAPLPLTNRHFVSGRPLQGPFPAGLARCELGMGCFWGAERRFWQTDGVFTTAVGYGGGFSPNPTYEEVCSGGTGHAELVLVIFDPQVLPFGELLRRFWEGHDPTQGMRQGNDLGTQYRSMILVADQAHLAQAEASRDAYQQALSQAGRGAITTEIRLAGAFYYAEDYHQQYLAKNPGGYCGLGGTGVPCPS